MRAAEVEWDFDQVKVGCVVLCWKEKREEKRQRGKQTITKRGEVIERASEWLGGL